MARNAAVGVSFAASASTALWPTRSAASKSLRFTKPASAIFTRIFDARSSQNRDDETMTSGPISRKSASIVSAVSGKFIVSPPMSVMPTPQIWSTIQAGGVMESQFDPMPMGVASIHLRAMAVKFRCESIASFGRPVVPEVWIMTATSSGRPRQSSDGKSWGFSRSRASPRSSSSRKLTSQGLPR